MLPFIDFQAVLRCTGGGGTSGSSSEGIPSTKDKTTVGAGTLMFLSIPSSNQPLANDSSSDEDGAIHCALDRSASGQMPRRSRRGVMKVPGRVVKVESAPQQAGRESELERPPVRSTSVPCAILLADNLRTRPRPPTSLEQQRHPPSSSSPSPMSDSSPTDVQLSPAVLVDEEEAVGNSLSDNNGEEAEMVTPVPSPMSLRSFHSVREEDSGHESPTERDTLAASPQGQELAQASQSWLMRLFQSKLFDMSIAIHYLFNSKEPGVQSYLGNKLFVSSVCVCVCVCVHVCTLVVQSPCALVVPCDL